MKIGKVDWEPGYGKKTYQPDPKPTKRVKDKKAGKTVHAAGCFCVLNCGAPAEAHHVLFRSQGGDDDPANMCCLCDDHHHKIHAEDAATKVLLGEHILAERPDTAAYLAAKAGADWIERRLLMVK